MSERDRPLLRGTTGSDRPTLYDEVRRRFLSGQRLLAIAREMDIARSTARAMAYAAQFPERAVRGPEPTVLQPHLRYLARRLSEGCESAMTLWREIRARGYAGSPKQVYRWLRPHRSAPAPTTPGHLRERIVARLRCRPTGASPALPSARRLAWLAVLPHERLKRREAQALARVRQHASVAEALGLIARFAHLVRDGCAQRRRSAGAVRKALGSSRDEACASAVSAVATFAAGIRQNQAAGSAALSLRWSNAQAEGQITKLKAIKRQMFGRAGFELLRRRVRLA